MYSMPVALMMSTMKSDPGRAMTLSPGGTEPFAFALGSAACDNAVLAARLVPMTTAALVAAPFRNERRSISLLLMVLLLGFCYKNDGNLFFGHSRRESTPLPITSDWLTFG